MVVGRGGGGWPSCVWSFWCYSRLVVGHHVHGNVGGQKVGVMKLYFTNLEECI